MAARAAAMRTAYSAAGKASRSPGWVSVMARCPRLPVACCRLLSAGFLHVPEHGDVVRGQHAGQRVAMRDDRVPLAERHVVAVGEGTGLIAAGDVQPSGEATCKRPVEPEVFKILVAGPAEQPLLAG